MLLSGIQHFKPLNWIPDQNRFGNDNLKASLARSLRSLNPLFLIIFAQIKLGETVANGTECDTEILGGSLADTGRFFERLE